MKTRRKRRTQRLDLARLHGVLLSACAASSVVSDNLARLYAVAFKGLHGNLALNPPPQPRSQAVRVRFKAKAVSAALACGCSRTWGNQTVGCKDYALLHLVQHLAKAG